MNWLTRQEKFIICVIIGLLLTGMAVKLYRTAHSGTIGSQPVKP
jgi:hypothetical protein